MMGGLFNFDISDITNGVLRSLEPHFNVVKNICKSAEIVARVLSQEHGLPAEGDVSRFQPRSLSKTPLIVEDTVLAGKTVEYNLEQLNQGRIPSRGYYRNIGVDPMRVTITGADGQATNIHTLLAKDVIAITNYVTKITVIGGATPSFIQILAQ
jgi:hypothetical protein